MCAQIMVSFLNPGTLFEEPHGSQHAESLLQIQISTATCSIQAPPFYKLMRNRTALAITWLNQIIYTQIRE